jgi:hypothetical protein
MSNELNEVHKEVLKEELIKELTEILMEELPKFQETDAYPDRGSLQDTRYDQNRTSS